MRVEIDFQEEANIVAGLSCEKAGCNYYAVVPDDTESFLRVVSPFGRFVMVPPNTEYHIPYQVEKGKTGDYWRLEFQNDYD
jgi:hypothetical protein